MFELRAGVCRTRGSVSGVSKSERDCRALEVRFTVEARVEFLRRGAPLVLFTVEVRLVVIVFSRRMSVDEEMILGSNFDLTGICGLFPFVFP